MALANYTDLPSSVADFLNRSDLTSVIPDFITLTEADINRSIRVREMSVRTRAPISEQYVKLPVDFLGMRNIELVTNPVTPLEYRNMQNLDRYRRPIQQGNPFTTQ